MRAGKDLNRAQAVSKTGSWRLDITGNELLWSDETYRIFGIPKGKSMKYETFLACIHPEDRDYVDQKWNAAMKGEPYYIEHRIIVGGKIKWVRERAELDFDSNGVLVSGFGTVQDITEHREAAEVITHTSRHWEDTFNSISDPISIHDNEFRVVKANRAFAEMLQTEDFIGERNPHDLISRVP